MTETEKQILAKALHCQAVTIIGYCDLAVRLVQDWRKNGGYTLQDIQEELRILSYGATALQKTYQVLNAAGLGVENQMLTSDHSDKSDGGSTFPSRESQASQPVT